MTSTSLSSVTQQKFFPVSSIHSFSGLNMFFPRRNLPHNFSLLTQHQPSLSVRVCHSKKKYPVVHNYIIYHVYIIYLCVLFSSISSLDFPFLTFAFLKHLKHLNPCLHHPIQHGSSPWVVPFLPQRGSQDPVRGPLRRRAGRAPEGARHDAPSLHIVGDGFASAPCRGAWDGPFFGWN